MKKVKDLVGVLNLKVISGENGLDREVNGAYVSDLLSDVMGNAKTGNMWITLQTHKNIIAVASLKDLAAIIVVKGFMPDRETIGKSEEEGIPILGTQNETFEIAGRLHSLFYGIEK